MDATDADIVKYSELKRVGVTYKDETMKRMQIVQCEMERPKFAIVLKRELAGFWEHVDRVAAQYSAVRQLKESLPPGQVICHMDFAENYLCSQADELQSAYFAKVAVTLHLAVVYYRDTDGGDLQHKS